VPESVRGGFGLSGGMLLGSTSEIPAAVWPYRHAVISPSDAQLTRREGWVLLLDRYQLQPAARNLIVNHSNT
jgi:hypothetical protein